MNRSFALLAALAFIGGCQSMAPTSTDKPSPEGTPSPAAAPAKPQAYGSFDESTLYSLLVAELAGQRNRFDLALGNYVQQANATQDPAVAERAFRIAEYLGAAQAALDSAMIWATNAPDNLDAQRAAAIQLARAGNYDESMAYMEKVLQGQGDTLLLQQDGRPQEALQLLEDQPATTDEVAPLLLRVRLLQSLKRGDEALPLLEKALRQHPDDKRVRLTYARVLVEQDRMDDAKREFSALVQQFPDDDDLRFSLALVSMEAGAWPEARIYLQELIERGSHVDAAHFNLGRVFEQLGDSESALIEYSLVGPGNDFLPAQVRQAEILFDQKRNDEASARLAKARDEQPDYAIQLYLIESESLSKRQLQDRAWTLMQQALKQYPDDSDLLYSRAMLAEKRNDLAQLEKDLRLITQREPDNAMALNALGYTLADRTTRFEEARQLVEQAHQLNPQDPAILDSLGWVNFRMGNLDEAERLLRQALQQFPDHEVAAHLGEVLWAQGKQREAKKIWSDALKAQPDSPVLRDTLQRHSGSETP